MFQPGISGNTRGRPSGSVGGRAQSLATLDRMLGKEENQQALFEALEKEFRTDPVRFFRNTVVPLIPRTMRKALPPDANDDWLPLERKHPSGPPPGPGPYVPPPPRSYPPAPEPVSSSGLPDPQPSALRPQTSVFRLQSSVLGSLLSRLGSRLSVLHSLLTNLHSPISRIQNLKFPSFPLSQRLTLHALLVTSACYLLLLNLFALITDCLPLRAPTLVHTVPVRLSRVVCAARVPVKNADVRGTRPRQPALEELGRLRMNGNGPVCHSAACPFGACANPAFPCYSLLLIPIPPVHPSAILLQSELSILSPRSTCPRTECGNTQSLYEQTSDSASPGREESDFFSGIKIQEGADLGIRRTVGGRDGWGWLRGGLPANSV